MTRLLERNSERPLYEQIYEQVRDDILSGRYPNGKKLPSKRALAEQLQVSLITVENAYSQLIAEGYVRAAQRSGYFAAYSGEAVANPGSKHRKLPENIKRDESMPQTGQQEFVRKSAGEEIFPFSVWTRLMRSVILEKGTRLLQPVDNGGAYELREAISDYLYRARGFYTPPENIIVGSGTEYLYNLLIQFLGRDKVFGIEEPGFPKLPKIYALNNVRFEYIPLDNSGMRVDELENRCVDIAHISPAHHFPTGIVMPISRRREILNWAESGERYIIEDDYDSEFRRNGKPLPTIFGSDDFSRVIYINTFSQTIAPSVRISYMCLSDELRERWREKLGFYACSVPAFEQYTLARFISEGYFERHINRARKRFKRVSELSDRLITGFGNVKISEENAGLHFTVKLTENVSEIVEKCAKCGIKVTPLKSYYASGTACESALFLVNYAGADEEKLIECLQ